METLNQEIQSYLKSHPAFQKWFDEQVSKKRQYVGKYMLYRFFKWAEQKDYTPEKLIQEHSKARGKAQYDHIELLKNYLKALNIASGSKRVILTNIKSFYQINRCPLPAIGRQELRRMLPIDDVERHQKLNMPTMTREHVRQLISIADEPYKTIYLVMFQTSMGISEFLWFNKNGWSQIKDNLASEKPIQIKLFREKELGVNEPYYTFLGRDAREALKTWLSVRNQKFGSIDKTFPGIIFLVFNRKKGGATGPISGHTIQKNIVAFARLVGLIKGTGSRRSRYGFNVHEFRDIFASLGTLVGANPVAVNYFLGHAIDPLKYDKSPQHDVEFFRNEYTKLEPALNVVSNPFPEQVQTQINLLKEDYEKIKKIVTEAIIKEPEIAQKFSDVKLSLESKGRRRRIQKKFGSSEG